MRTLPAQLNTNIAQTFTSGGYLAEIEIVPNTFLRFSSRGNQSWDGKSWNLAMVIDSLSEVAGGGMSGSLSLDNFDDGLSDWFEDYEPRGRPIKIWQGDNTQYILKLNGEIDEVPGIGPDIGITVTSVGRVKQFSPRIVIGEPFCSYLTSPGTVIDWQSERIVLNGP